MSTYCLLWEFRVQAPHRAKFVAHYAADGAWAQLFARAPGFIATELLADEVDPLRFVTIDRWRQQADFAAFKATHATAYAALDARCAHWTASERLLGCFVAPA